jgi:hypothetical protein
MSSGLEQDWEAFVQKNSNSAVIPIKEIISFMENSVINRYLSLEEHR